MAFMISKAPPSFSQSENPNKSNLNGNDALSQGQSNNAVVSSRLLLKSAGKMDRDVVLRRIRFYRRLKKVKGTFEGLVGGGGGGGSEAANAAADEAERLWLQQHDVFSAP